MEGEGVQPPPVLVVEEEVVQPPPLVEEEGVVAQPPPLMEEVEVVVHPPPLVEDEEMVVHPPPLVAEEEEVVVQPPPLVEEEEVVVVQVQPPPLVAEGEEVVAQPPPLVEEEQEVVQPPPLVEEEEVAPDPYAFLLWQWVAATLGHAARYRHLVATGVDEVIDRCEAARVTLREVSAVLVDEPIGAAETIYAALLDAVSRGMDSLLIGPAANIVDSLFNWPGPLAGAIDFARDLVHKTFYQPEPEGGPLQGARRDLGYLFDVVHADAGHYFSLYAATLGHDALPGGHGAFELWGANHNQADGWARVAQERMNIAVERSLEADLSVLLCGIIPVSRARPGAWQLVPLAVQRLQQTISAVDDVLVPLHEMRDTLVEVEQDVLDVTGGQDPPPP
ncbi:hypothetical protein ZWY2020_050114 [Hordeum vulgare]|nr:hypothetical protein ZWY2020_050114 [Hordeum vulgare]